MLSPSASPALHPVRSVVLAVLVVLLGLPLALTLVRGPATLDENRAAQSLPHVPTDLAALAQFPMRFELAFDRSFQLRPALVSLWSRVIVLGLRGASLKPLGALPVRNVIVGREGELFYGGESSVEGHRAVDSPALRAAADAWIEQLAQRHATLQGQRVRYAVVFAPDKQTLHDDALPPWARRVGTPVVDRVIAGARARGVEVIDVRPALLQAHARVRTTWRTDSHWNDVGACVAALEVKRELGWVSNDACTAPVELVEQPGGDLALLLGLRDGLAETLPRPRDVPRAEGAGPSWQGSGSARALLVGDSCAGALAPFLGAAFSQMDVVRELPAVHAGIEVVVEEIVERRLAAAP